jgi:hypothetical protein
MPTFTTPRRTCIGHTAGSFNPLSEALSTADLCEVRFRLWATEFKAGTKLYPGIQFSNDGIAWNTAVAFNGFSTTTDAPEGWDYTTFDVWKNLFVDGAGGLDSTPTRALFCRVGAFVVAPGGTSFGQVALAIEAKPIPARTVQGGPVTLNSLGSTTDNFQACTDWVPVLDSTYARFSYELLATSNQVEIAPAYQVANYTDVDSDSLVRAVPDLTARSAVGITYGTTFATWYSTSGPDNSGDADYRLIRFGFVTRNASGTTLEGAVGKLRVDLRDRQS